MCMPLEEEGLDEYEVLARERLENLLGLELRRIRPGGPAKRHDFEATQDDGRIVAVEVTSRLDDHRREQLSAIRQRLATFRLPGSAKVWAVQLAACAHVGKVSKAKLGELLIDLEAQGRARAHAGQNYLDSFVQRMRDLRIASVYAMGSHREGRVVIGQDAYGGRGWYGSVTDSWLEDFLTSELGQGKLEKLSRVANAAQRHLVIVLDPTSPEGMAIPLGLMDRDEPDITDQIMPSSTPPEPLSHAWLFPTVETWEGLRWARGGGWAVVPALRPASAG
jgi:hypothetical protein